MPTCQPDVVDSTSRENYDVRYFDGTDRARGTPTSVGWYYKANVWIGPYHSKREALRGSALHTACGGLPGR